MADEITTCRFCGAEAAPDDRRCPSCGKRLAAVRASAISTAPPAVEIAEGAAEPELSSTACWKCQRNPAVYCVFRSSTGMLVLHRFAIVPGWYCRPCGLALFRRHMNHTLLLGWWGILSFFFNFAAIFRNIQSWARLRTLDPPEGEPVAPPLAPGRPVWQLPGMYVTAAIVALAFVLLGNSTGADAEEFNGRCVDIDRSSNRVKQVPCRGEHDGKVVDVVKAANQCPEGSDGTLRIKSDNKSFICVDIDQ